ncbi:MAG: NAD(P)/FAD-dependent oxidoreductase, partial [Rhodoferax sp.]|nr:NAD(P)/FAD-dependent oxidoreductase [Rhodoferax sp.]
MTQTMPQKIDCVVVGAGHNGLVCATYLARAGRSVMVLEAADQVGGAARTRQLGAEAKVSSGAHLLYALPGKLQRELQLQSHGLRFAAQGLSTLSLSETGKVMELGKELGKQLGTEPVPTSMGAAALSPADLKAYARFQADMDRFAKALLPVFDKLPARVTPQSWIERLQLLGLGWAIRKLGAFHMREFLRIIGLNLYDLLDEYFDNAQLKAAIAMDGLLGSEWGPRSMGSVLTYLNRRVAMLRGEGTGLALPEGGMGAVTQALAAAAKAAGVHIHTATGVRRILVQDGRTTGVELNSGSVVQAACVISNADPKRTFLQLVSAEHLDAGFVRRIKNLRCRGHVGKLHLVLQGQPAFRGLEPGKLGQRLLIAPTMDAIELAFNPCKYQGYPDAPVLEITVPSVHDKSLTHPDQHVLSAVVQYLPYDDSAREDANRAAFLQTLLALLERYAPAIGSQVLHGELLTPRDIEREFGITGGHWHHVEMAFETFYFNRPVPALARHATPIQGLYLCGAGTHPG